MNIILTQSEVADLFSDPQPTGGGFQSLVSKLQDNCNQTTGQIYLDPDCLERIPRYAFKYHQGGWEDQLIRIFYRTLGPNLGGTAQYRLLCSLDGTPKFGTLINDGLIFDRGNVNWLEEETKGQLLPANGAQAVVPGGEWELNVQGCSHGFPLLNVARSETATGSHYVFQLA